MTGTPNLPPRWQLALNQIDAHSRAMRRYVPPAVLPFLPCLLGTIAGGFIGVLIVGAVLTWGAR